MPATRPDREPTTTQLATIGAAASAPPMAQIESLRLPDSFSLSESVSLRQLVSTADLNNLLEQQHHQQGSTASYARASHENFIRSRSYRGSQPVSAPCDSSMYRLPSLRRLALRSASSPSTACPAPKSIVG